MTKPPTRITKSVRRKAAVALLAVLATLAISALGVYAAADSTGSSASADASAAAGKSFTISGDMEAALSLSGAGQPLNLRVSNPNPQTLTVTTLEVTVTGTSAANCPVAPNFTVTHTSATLTVPPRSTVAVPAASRPRVVWVNTTDEQNACLGAELRLSYTGKGTLR